MTEPCAFCRIGSCGIHHVLRFQAVTGRSKTLDDDEMAPVGCCDSMQAAVNYGVFRMREGKLTMTARGQNWVVVRCPFCSWDS